MELNLWSNVSGESFFLLHNNHPFTTRFRIILYFCLKNTLLIVDQLLLLLDAYKSLCDLSTLIFTSNIINKLAKLEDVIAISKSETLAD